ncbi:cation-transporting P-type ATPase [Streptomyces tritici]|uniref:cation-transporting P-type ATPase n=1 Tax=Streptomyces tritici TaxID=2054410 RepID=UPI003AF0C9C6
MTASAPHRAPAPGRETTGLTQEEAARRLADTGSNEVAARKPVPLRKRVLAQLTDPLIMVLLGAVVLTLAIGDHPDAIVIGLVVLVNTTVGVAQEIRADNAVAALSALTAPHARVRRDGTVCDPSPFWATAGRRKATSSRGRTWPQAALPTSPRCGSSPARTPSRSWTSWRRGGPGEP